MAVPPPPPPPPPAPAPAPMSSASYHTPASHVSPFIDDHVSGHSSAATASSTTATAPDGRPAHSAMHAVSRAVYPQPVDNGMLPRVPDSGDWTSSNSPRYGGSAPLTASAPSFFPSSASGGHAAAAPPPPPLPSTLTGPPPPPPPPPGSYGGGYGTPYDPYASSRSAHPMYAEPVREVPSSMYPPPPYGGYSVPMPPTGSTEPERWDYPPYNPHMYMINRDHQMMQPFDRSSSMIPSAPPAPKRPKARIDGLTRKRVCQYADVHPDMRQADIAAVFHVERSTISKILKQKAKWLALNGAGSGGGDDDVGAHRTPPIAPIHRYDPIGYHARPSSAEQGSFTASSPNSPRPSSTLAPTAPTVAAAVTATAPTSSAPVPSASMETAPTTSTETKLSASAAPPPPESTEVASSASTEPAQTTSVKPTSEPVASTIESNQEPEQPQPNLKVEPESTTSEEPKKEA